MSKQSFPVLITRPEPQASRFAAHLRGLFGPRVLPVVAPLMQVEFLPVALPPTPFAALVLTSETGAEAAGRLAKTGLRLPDLAFCVGDRTAEAARALGLTALSAAGDAGALVALILNAPDPGPMLYLHGQDRAADLAGQLKGLRNITPRAAYVQNALPLPETARALLAQAGPVILPLFSPRSARLAMASLPADSAATLQPVVISTNTRDALPPDLAEQAILAAAPDAKAMIQAIARLLPPASP